MPREIERVIRRDETIIRVVGSGDNFHSTWTDDGLLVTFNDGAGFPGVTSMESTFNSKLLAVHGTPPDITLADVPGYPLIDSANVAAVGGYYGFATLSIEGTIYQFLSVPTEEPMLFQGAKLIYSPDRGATWHNQDGSTPVSFPALEDRSRDSLLFWQEPRTSFALISVLQMGQEYRLNTDGFVYLYSPNGTVEGEMNQLALLRVPKDRVLDRDAYEYFTGREADGSATWSSDFDALRPVHVFPSGWVTSADHPYSWQPSVTYNAPLGLYLMASWGFPPNEEDRWFMGPSYLGIWSSPTPWGPWTQIHEDTAWRPGDDESARCYQPQIPAAWISEDGTSFWLIWTDFQAMLPGNDPARAFGVITPGSAAEHIEQWRGLMPYYSMNLQRVDLVVSEE
jgi:hypothetical protein